MVMVCDKFHFKNHKDMWCKRNCSPYTCASLHLRLPLIQHHDYFNLLYRHDCFTGTGKYTRLKSLLKPLRTVQAHGLIRIQIWELTLQRLVAALSIIYTIYVISGNIYPENKLRNQFMLFSVIYQNMKLQHVMNASLRLIYRAHKFCHITPLLAELHWLPVQSRIHYKILLTTFKFCMAYHLSTFQI